MNTPFDQEFWQDESQWPLSFDIRNERHIFLLDALRRYGRGRFSEKWDQISSIYTDPELASTYMFDPAEYSEWLHRLLLRVDRQYVPRPHHGRPDEDGYDLRYRFDDRSVDLAGSIAEHIPPLDPEQLKMHSAAVDELVKKFLLGGVRLAARAGDDSKSEPLDRRAWLGTKEKTRQRFVFGQVDVAGENAWNDSPRGSHWIFVHEDGFSKLLEELGLRELTMHERMVKRMIELDADPEGPATADELIAVNRGEFSTKKTGVREPERVAAYREARESFRRLGRSRKSKA